MAKNISLMGADYPDVPAVELPQTGGGKAVFYDINVVDNLNSTSSTDALSANQGRVLNNKIATKTPEESAAGFRINKAGNVVAVYIDKSVTATGSGWKKIETLPDGYRPTYMIYTIGFDNLQAGTVPVPVRVHPESGNAELYFDAAGTIQIRTTIVFITD